MTRRRNELRRDECDRRFPGVLDLAIVEGRSLATVRALDERG